MSSEGSIERAGRRGISGVQRLATAWRARRPSGHGQENPTPGTASLRAEAPPPPGPAPEAPPAEPPVVAEPEEAGADELEALPVRHGVPVPPGTTTEELLARFRTWSVNGEPPGHLDVYLDDSFERFLFTCYLVPDAPGRALELGANPYFTTHLVDEFTPLELDLVNFYGDDGRGTECDETVEWADADGTRHTRTYRSHLLNVEEDRLPFEDGRFDVVLFCEVIEHLLMDPLQVLREVHRVLAPGGLIVVTTPNVARLTNVLALLNGANLYDPYSGYGPYGRHNREYTRHELHQLLAFAGFEVDISFTADGHEEDITDLPLYDEAVPLVRFRSPDLGHYLFARGRKVGPPREGRPRFLYRSLAAGELVD